LETVLLDTCIISFFLKTDERAKHYEPYVDNNRLVVSFMTIAELYRWTITKKWGLKRKLDLEKYLSKFIVYPFTDHLCYKWAEVVEEMKDKGNPISCADAWIAATALLLDIPIVTHNKKDFCEINHLKVIS